MSEGEGRRGGSAAHGPRIGEGGPYKRDGPVQARGRLSPEHDVGVVLAGDGAVGGHHRDGQVVDLGELGRLGGGGALGRGIIRSGQGRLGVGLGDEKESGLGGGGALRAGHGCMGEQTIEQGFMPARILARCDANTLGLLEPKKPDWYRGKHMSPAPLRTICPTLALQTGSLTVMPASFG